MGEQHALSMGAMGLGTGSITNEVLAVVSHDLRNPLNIISVGASLLDYAPCSILIALSRT